MNITKKDLAKSQIELIVKLSAQEFKPYIIKGAEKISREIKIEGFRPGKVPYKILKQKIGEMTILEEAARIAINKTLDKAIEKNTDRQPVGQPEVNITKLAPDNPLEYKIILALLPEITLENYKGLKIKEKKTEAREEEIEQMIQYLRDMRAKETKVSREAQEGDKVIIDTEMFLDKVPVDGGQGKDTVIIIGKNYIVPGLDKKIIGGRKGDTREFSLPYPKDYHMANLAGKMVDFKVGVKEVYERALPKLDERFAANFGLRGTDELRKNIKKSITIQKERENAQVAEREMLEKIIEKTKFGDIPEVLVDHEAKTMLAELEQNIASQGGKFEEYLQSINKTQNELTLDLLPEAIKRVKSSLLIREIANIEKIKVSDEEVDKYIADIKKHYQNKDKKIAEQANSPEYRNHAINILANRKVIDRLRKWNVIK